MAMLVKPLESDNPDLARFEKKPALLQPVDEEAAAALSRGELTPQEKTRLIALLEHQLPLVYEAEVPFDPDPEPVVNSDSSKVTDDGGEQLLLDKWLASANTPVRWKDLDDPSNRECKPLVSDLSLREWHTARYKRSQKVREINGSKHDCLLDYVWEARIPTKGWWLSRPPTLDQLFNTTQRAVKYVAAERRERSIKRMARIEGLKAWMATNRSRKNESLYDDMFLNNEAANDSGVSLQWQKAELDAEMFYLREKRRLDCWLWKHNKVHNCRSPFDHVGLAKFFRDTGVPENDVNFYRKYWALQKLAAWEYTPEQLYDQYHARENQYRSNQNETHYRYYWDNRPDQDRLNAWLLKHAPCNGHFLPDKPYKKPGTALQRKLNAYMLSINRIDTDDQSSIDRVHAVRRQLFVAKTEGYREFQRKYYTDDEPRPRTTVKPTRIQVKDPNADKVWPTLGLPNRCRDEAENALVLRLTERIYSEERIRDLIREEMQGLTKSLTNEFQVAMSDVVMEVTERAIAAISEALSRGKPAPTLYPMMVN